MMSFEALVTKYGNNLKKFRTTQFKSHLKLKTGLVRTASFKSLDLGKKVAVT